PVIILSSVVLPAPLGPRNPNISPLRISRLKLSTALVPLPWVFDTSRILIISFPPRLTELFAYSFNYTSLGESCLRNCQKKHRSALDSRLVPAQEVEFAQLHMTQFIEHVHRGCVALRAADIHIDFTFPRLAL